MHGALGGIHLGSGTLGTALVHLDQALRFQDLATGVLTHCSGDRGFESVKNCGQATDA